MGGGGRGNALTEEHGFFGKEERENKEEAGKGKLDVEKEVPGVASREHEAREHGACRAQAKRNRIPTQLLATLVQEEYVVDQLHGQSFADARSKRVHHAGAHQAGVGRGLGGPDDAQSVQKEGQQDDGSAANLAVQRDEDEVAKPEYQIRVVHEASRRVGVDSKLGGPQANVRRRTQERRDAQERESAADNHNGVLLPGWPLQRVVGVCRRHGEEGLAIMCLLAFLGLEIHSAGDPFFSGMAKDEVQAVSHAAELTLVGLPVLTCGNCAGQPC